MADVGFELWTSQFIGHFQPPLFPRSWLFSSNDACKSWKYVLSFSQTKDLIHPNWGPFVRLWSKGVKFVLKSLQFKLVGFQKYVDFVQQNRLVTVVEYGWIGYWGKGRYIKIFLYLCHLFVGKRKATGSWIAGKERKIREDVQRMAAKSSKQAPPSISWLCLCLHQWKISWFVSVLDK